MFDTFEIGKVYKFGYNGQERKIIVSNVQIGGVTGFDFSVDGFRSFTISKIQGKVEKIEDSDEQAEVPNSWGIDWSKQIGFLGGI